METENDHWKTPIQWWMKERVGSKEGVRRIGDKKNLVGLLLGGDPARSIPPPTDLGNVLQGEPILASEYSQTSNDSCLKLTAISLSRVQTSKVQPNFLDNLL